MACSVFHSTIDILSTNNDLIICHLDTLKQDISPIQKRLEFAQDSTAQVPQSLRFDQEDIEEHEESFLEGIGIGIDLQGGKRDRRRAGGYVQRPNQSRGKTLPPLKPGIGPPHHQLRTSKRAPFQDARNRSNTMVPSTRTSADAIKMQQEIESLKRQLAEEQKKVKPNSKRAKFVPKEVVKDKETSEMLKGKVKDHVYPEWKFLGNEEEEIAALTLSVKACPKLWNEIKHLNEEDLYVQMKEYNKHYGQDHSKQVNTVRNQHQQNMRRAWQVHYKETGEAVSSSRWLKVARRPKRLIRKKEVKSNGQPSTSNVQHNEANKKHFDRLVDWIDVMIPGMVGTRLYGPRIRTAHTIAKYERDGVPVITCSDEAMGLLFIENAMPKWIYEVELEKRWGRELDKKDRYTKEYKENCPATKWTNADAGANKNGGWENKGKTRYAQLRGLIKEGREQDHTAYLEEQVRAVIVERHEEFQKNLKEKEKKQGTIDLTGAVGTETMEVQPEEDCDSDAEDADLLALNEGANYIEDPKAPPKDEDDEDDEGDDEGKKGGADSKEGANEKKTKGKANPKEAAPAAKEDDESADDSE